MTLAYETPLLFSTFVLPSRKASISPVHMSAGVVEVGGRVYAVHRLDPGGIGVRLVPHLIGEHGLASGRQALNPHARFGKPLVQVAQRDLAVRRTDGQPARRHRLSIGQSRDGSGGGHEGEAGEANESSLDGTHDNLPVG
jgi:hypothetical protein